MRMRLVRERTELLRLHLPAHPNGAPAALKQAARLGAEAGVGTILPQTDRQTRAARLRDRRGTACRHQKRLFRGLRQLQRAQSGTEPERLY